MQFAGGLSVKAVAEIWDRDVAWVEDAIRNAVLRRIPKRDGGMMPARATARAERSDEAAVLRAMQPELKWG